MKRRSFLKTAAALVPASGFEAFALAQTASTPKNDQVHLVPNGEDRLGESHSRGYSSILFKAMPNETNNGLLIIEHTHLVKGGPPLHLHVRQEEWFYVVEGEVLMQVGDSRHHLRPGDSILGRPSALMRPEGEPTRTSGGAGWRRLETEIPTSRQGSRM